MLVMDTMVQIELIKIGILTPELPQTCFQSSTGFATDFVA